ncbi:alpha-galactosidase [Streptococcus pasteurianus]|uniref:alpha-galactosidase n=1 Tax=Streptococcus pasteurianus TaxID=197614 RepID=UPI0022842FD8|nr:alpha-galactosidase [Streptococcus pasteurianus]MCY7248664.1 alpha-galactosidase [Streptococcus pasteurianus]
MKIEYRDDDATFILENDSISYVIQIVKDRYVQHCYFGKKIRDFKGSCKNWMYDRGFCSNPDENDRTFSLDTMLREFPDINQGDYRHSAYQIESEDGDSVTRFYYKSYNIYKGKKAIAGLPSVYVESEDEAMTLELTLFDTVRLLEINLFYTIYRDYSVITRSSELVNKSDESIKLKRLMSFNLDMQDNRWDVMTLSGSHTNEKNIYRRKLGSDTLLVESSRGTSSPQSTPFIALVRPETTEKSGEVIASNLIYSGNFAGFVQKSQYGTVRVQMGINPETFCWHLNPSKTFASPESVLVYSENGLQGMSQTFHSFYRKRLCRGEYRDLARPVLLNTWEAMYFEVSEEKFLNLAKEASELGVETIVLDDGWFKGRLDDTSSLGDWVMDVKKFPKGLKYLSEQVEHFGLKLGIWLEPEMISKKSDLYQQHPDWVIRSNRYEPIVSRAQYVLDLTNPDVCSYLIEAISLVLTEGNIAYVKWDMNRHLTDLYSTFLSAEQQGELSHRYVLGLYSILETLNQRFPHILFENCSSGGGRYDAGMLYYMPQTWASDNTDAISRLKIQQGTSLIFPAITMGSHVSGVPNHQVGRVTPLKTRFHVAMSGNLGYELDITKLSDIEKNEIAEQIIFYKSIRDVVQFGHYYRLSDFTKQNQGGWQFVSEDGKDVLVTYVQILSQPAYEIPILYLNGLDPKANYREKGSGEIYGGDELMYSGLTIPRTKEDFHSTLYQFEKI